MRYIRSSVAVVTVFAALLVGCATTADPEPAETTEVQVQEQAQGEVSPQAICPLRWTCDSGRFYSTKASCETACGVGTCYRDYACTGGCVCP